MMKSAFRPLTRELVFDIDMTDCESPSSPSLLVRSDLTLPDACRRLDPHLLQGQEDVQAVLALHHGRRQGPRRDPAQCVARPLARLIAHAHQLPSSPRVQPTLALCTSSGSTLVGVVSTPGSATRRRSTSPTSSAAPLCATSTLSRATRPWTSVSRPPSLCTRASGTSARNVCQ